MARRSLQRHIVASAGIAAELDCTGSALALGLDPAEDYKSLADLLVPVAELVAAVAAVALVLAVRILRLVLRRAIQWTETSRYCLGTGESSAYRLRLQQLHLRPMQIGKTESEQEL